MGHFFKTQPTPKFLDPTQPNPQKSSPDPTQPIIDTWYGILGYTENFIQQLLHVTDKFTVRSSNESQRSPAFSPHFSSSTDSTVFADSCDSHWLQCVPQRRSLFIQLQYSLTDSRVFHDVKNITQSSLHPTQPMDGPNP